nr:ABC transporter ATP-binding protein [Amycolatopsis jejuensis]
MTAPSAALALTDVTAGYRGTTVLRDVSLTVPHSSIVALLGPNGAGKTTVMRVASGTVPATHGAVSIDGGVVTTEPPHRRAEAGLCLIPEGRGIFAGLTVRENLTLYLPPGAPASLDRALGTFPEVGKRFGQIAGTMSGGQQQMLALCRAWIARPRVVLLDEVSMGLAPKIVDDIFGRLHELAADGVALVIVEQYVRRALDIADVVYLLDKGRVRFSGAPSELDQEALIGGYFGHES